MKKHLLLPILSLMVAACLAGCSLAGATQGASTAQQGSATSNAGMGTLEVSITDAPRHDQVTKVWVTIGDVQVHKAGIGQDDDSDGSWMTVLEDVGEVELLSLTNGIVQKLGSAQLASGNYTQVRLEVVSAKVQLNGGGDNVTAEVPSGKIKLVHPFEVKDGCITGLKLDFDALKSVNLTPNKVMIKPVIKIVSDAPRSATSKPQDDDKIELCPVSLPNGAVNVAYAAAIGASGNQTPCTFTVTGGSLPPGLTLSTSGHISGTPTSSGNFTFTVKATDTSVTHKTGTREYRVRIAPEGT